jgi:PAS domain S-box-containing protein
MTVSLSAGQEFKKQNLDPELFTGLSVEEIFKDNSTIIKEEYKKTFDGEERSFELFVNNQYQLYRTVPLVSEDRSINRILAVVENITERKLAEKKLQESEELFRTLTEAMPQIVWRADNNGIIDYYNEKAYEFHGINKGEIEKLSWNSIINPEDYNETLTKWEEAIITGKIFSTEQRLLRADGEYRWHLTRGVPVKDMSGKIIRWIGTATDIHDQKSYEEILEKRVNEQTQEIRKANKYNRTLLEASLDSLVTIGPDGIITDANKAAELIRGIDRNELIGTNFSSFFTEPEKAREAYIKVFSDGAIKDFPLTLKHSSGKTTDVLYNASVYKNEAGKVEGIFAAARDITEIKGAEKSIRLQADQHHTMLSTTPDGFWVADTNGKMIDVNDNYLKMSGYTREEFLNLSIPDLEALETTEETAQHIKKIFQTGFDRFESKHKRKDGTFFNVEISTSYLKTANYFIVFIRDITERKRSEERLQIERKRFNDVLEMLPAFVELLTPDYIVKQSNSFFTSRFGENKGKHCYESLNNMTKPCENCKTYMVIEKKEPIEWEWKGPDGRDYYIYDFPFRDVDGTDLILKMGIDITEMKRAEQQIIKLNEDLEKRVQQRTTELQLANKELEAFSYSVSHDLRTPLSAIDGFSKILQRDLTNQLNDEYKEYLNRIISAADKMSVLITGLLNLSRISGVELQSNDVRLDLIATEIINRLIKSEPSRKVKVTVQADIIVNADSEFITIVMENLINNAWKFTRYKKEAKIKIGAKQQNGEAIYFVKDNGIGFDMKNSEKLFTPFQRFHDCKKFEGSGIGLATVKRIIAKHGGRIWAESEMDKGTSFYFVIPG